jgi:magnesium transporter
MEPDDATDVVDELDEAEARGILAEMRAEEADEIRELLAYPSHTAGGRMTPEFISISPNVTAAAGMRLLRAYAPSAETIYYIYVTDRAEQLVGVVSLRDLIIADPQRQIREIMRHQVFRVPVDADQEEAARLLTEHDLLAVPVVDAKGRLVGVVTADDISDVLEEEATEDIERLGGSQPLTTSYLRAPLVDLFRKRIGWLMILFLAGTYTSFVLQTFSDTLSHLVALTFFVPLLVGTGGNVGSQIVTTVVRALAVGDVSVADARRVIGRELAVAVAIGLVMAAVIFIRAETMDVGLDVAKVVALSAVFIVVWSALVAAGLPLVLHRLRLDPAVVSAPLMTTLVDGTGLIMYLTTAHFLLGL